MAQLMKRLRLHRLLRNRKAVFGLLVLLIGGVAAAWPQAFTSFDPLAKDLAIRLKPPGWAGPGGAHLLGTDSLGRDVFTRVVYGARISLTIGFLSVAIAAPIGVTTGLAAGYFGGWFDSVIMRLADIQLALPTVLLAVTFVAGLGQGSGVLIIVLGVSGWVLYARVVRSSTLRVSNQEYVVAAIATGARHGRIIARHLLPNVSSSVIVLATFNVAQVILLESTLSFLGLGVPPPNPTWGGMLNDSRDYITSAWWLGVFPGLAIMLVVFSINVVGDWLRDMLDPRLKQL